MKAATSFSLLLFGSLFALALQTGYSSISPARNAKISHVSLGGEPKLLGEGSFAVVFKINVQGKYFALRTKKVGIQTEGREKDHSAREEIILRILQCDLPTPERQYFVLPDPMFEQPVLFNETTFPLSSGSGIVMEYCDGGDLFQYLTYMTSGARSKLKTLQMVKWAVQISHALKALDEVRVVHGDIKLDNILLKSSESGEFNAFLSDFGASARSNIDRLSAATEGYAAPELFSQRNEPVQGSASDVFSFGSVLLQLFNKRTYFLPETLTDLQKAFHSNPLDPKLKKLHPLVKRCWNRDPAQRPSPAVLVEELSKGLRTPNNPWNLPVFKRRNIHIVPLHISPVLFPRPAHQIQRRRFTRS